MKLENIQDRIDEIKLGSPLVSIKDLINSASENKTTIQFISERYRIINIRIEDGFVFVTAEE